jgi:hypothetical protein
MRPTRRALLGGGALLAGGWALGHLWGHRPIGGSAGPFLGASARRTLEAALEALLPEGASPAEVAEGVDRFLVGSDPAVGGQLRLALGVLEHVGGAGPLAFSSFSRLPLERRREVLEGWRGSRVGALRQVADALRRVALFAWYTRESAWAGIGYDGPWVRP